MLGHRPEVQAICGGVPNLGTWQELPFLAADDKASVLRISPDGLGQKPTSSTVFDNWEEPVLGT